MDSLMWFSMTASMTVTVLALIVEHYAPWGNYVTGKERLHPVVNYIAGLLAIFVPFTVLALFWQAELRLASATLLVAVLWAHAAAGGLAVGGCYVVDAWHAEHIRRKEAEEREQAGQS